MPAYYLETGALLKRYRPEAGSDVVNELFESRQPDDLFTTSQFTLVEMKSVVARMLKGRELRRRQHDRLLARFFNDLYAYHVHVLPVESSLLDEALDLYPDHPLRAPDALHFMSAVHFDRRFTPPAFYVVSGDKDIVEACRDYPLQLIDPEAPEALDYVRSLR